MAFYGYRGKMTAEERRVLARERVKAWKAAHPKSVIWQRERRYARKKAKGQASRTGVRIELKIVGKVEPREVQETYYEHPALSEGDPDTVREHARSVARRKGVGVPVGLMEPEQNRGSEGIQKDVGLYDEGGTVRERFEALKGRGDLALKVMGQRVSAELAQRMVEDHAKKKRPGVEVDLELP